MNEYTHTHTLNTYSMLKSAHFIQDTPQGPNITAEGGGQTDRGKFRVQSINKASTFTGKDSLFFIGEGRHYLTPLLSDKK